MLVRNIMRRGAVTCNENSTVRSIAQIMVINRTRYCVVINNNKEVLGVVSADVMIRHYGKDLDSLRAKDILLPFTVTITPSTPIEDAISLMCKKKINNLIVVSDKPGSKAVLGIIKAVDIIKKMAEEVKPIEGM